VEEQLKSSAKGSVAATLENSELKSQMEKLKKKHEDLKQSADRVLRENDELSGKAAGLEQVICCVLGINIPWGWLCSLVLCSPVSSYHSPLQELENLRQNLSAEIEILRNLNLQVKSGLPPLTRSNAHKALCAHIYTPLVYVV
jgi:hypothetical protein